MSLGHALPVSCCGNCDPQASCLLCPGSLHDATRRAEDRDYLGYLVGHCSHWLRKTWFALGPIVYRTI